MADKKLTAITDTGVIAADVVYGVRGGNSRRIRLSGAAAKDTGTFLSDTGFALSDTGFALSDTGFASSALAASQSQQETGTATNVYVTPGRQQFHLGHPKFLAMVTVSAGTPTLQTSFNVTSITDTAAGRLTVTIATDFSSANWACSVTTERTSDDDSESNTRITNVGFSGLAAGSVLVEARDAAGTTHVEADPASWHVIGFGDQA